VRTFVHVILQRNSCPYVISSPPGLGTRRRRRPRASTHNFPQPPNPGSATGLALDPTPSPGRGGSGTSRVPPPVSSRSAPSGGRGPQRPPGGSLPCGASGLSFSQAGTGEHSHLLWLHSRSWKRRRPRQAGTKTPWSLGAKRSAVGGSALRDPPRQLISARPLPAATVHVSNTNHDLPHVPQRRHRFAILCKLLIRIHVTVYVFTVYVANTNHDLRQRGFGSCPGRCRR